MRLALAAAVLLAAWLTLVPAAAYKRAAATGSLSLTVTATDSAALQLGTGSGGSNTAGTAYYSSGAREALYLDFRKGQPACGVSISCGFGPPDTPAAGVTVAGDRYRYRGLFRVTNRSASARCISVHVPGGGVTGLEAIYLRAPGDFGSGTAVAGTGGVRSGCVSVAAGAAVDVDFWWNISSASASGSFNVRVEGQR